MNKREWKYIAVIVSLFVFYVMIEVLSPPPENWSVTYDENHKIPFGTYALDKLLPGIFQGQKINHSNSTIYEITNSDAEFENLVILCNRFMPGEEDTKAIFELLERGNHIFIASEWMNGKLFDTLNTYLSHSIVRQMTNDTISMSMVGDAFPEKGPFKFHSSHASMFFYKYDSVKTEIIAVNQQKDPVCIRYRFDRGSLVLFSVPMAFTNYYLLHESNPYFASNTLSLLPVGPVHFTNFYQYGRMEPVSKLRFVLTQPSLKWALFLAIAAVVIYALFESKRRQRAIPVIKQPSNSTLDFIGTMGNLYLNKGNNVNIAHKKITYFLDHLRQRYYLKTDTLDKEFVSRLAMKTNKSPEEAQELVNLIKELEGKKSIDYYELIKLNQKIEDYYFN